MENASKALIMAGGILIALMVASLMVYLFTTYGSQAKDMYDRIYERQQIEALNEYTKYEGSKDNTIYDVVTVINKAQDNNESLNLVSGQQGYINVKFTGSRLSSISGLSNTSLEKATNTQIAQLLQTYADNGARFSCRVDSKLLEDNSVIITSVSFSIDRFVT